MVYATLFGISKQVISDMRKINPEFFESDNIADQMVASVEVPVIYTVLHQGISEAYINKLAREYQASGGSSRSFGGGGHSSLEVVAASLEEAAVEESDKQKGSDWSLFLLHIYNN